MAWWLAMAALPPLPMNITLPPAAVWPLMSAVAAVTAAPKGRGAGGVGGFDAGEQIGEIGKEARDHLSSAVMNLKRGTGSTGVRLPTMRTARAPTALPT